MYLVVILANSPRAAARLVKVFVQVDLWGAAIVLQLLVSARSSVLLSQSGRYLLPYDY
jgi:hypothetical protein